jgi:hypothetical protein
MHEHENLQSFRFWLVETTSVSSPAAETAGKGKQRAPVNSRSIIPPIGRFCRFRALVYIELDLSRGTICRGLACSRKKKLRGSAHREREPELHGGGATVAE